MATDKFPNRNVNMPMDEGAVAAARERLAPARSFSAPPPAAANGKGSRREVRAGEWIDDRRIEIGGPSSPSEDSPPELPGTKGTPPASYDPLKVYQIQLGKPAMHAGRTLSPGKLYMMVGTACTAISGSVLDAVEMGDVPVDPDAQPSMTKKSKA